MHLYKCSKVAEVTPSTNSTNIFTYIPPSAGAFSEFLAGRQSYTHFAKNHLSKKSPTGPTEWTPKPEYLIARSQLT